MHVFLPEFSMYCISCGYCIVFDWTETFNQHKSKRHQHSILHSRIKILIMFSERHQKNLQPAENEEVTCDINLESAR